MHVMYDRVDYGLLLLANDYYLCGVVITKGVCFGPCLMLRFVCLCLLLYRGI
jgi:hypothetical protein